MTTEKEIEKITKIIYSYNKDILDYLLFEIPIKIVIKLIENNNKIKQNDNRKRNRIIRKD